MRILFKSFTFLSIIFVLAIFQLAFANPEECDEDGFIKGSACPCFSTPGAVSICGNIGRAGIEQVTEYKAVSDKDIYMTLRPIENVVINIYENNPLYPGTVGPFGDFDSKLGHCTTNAQGNYACMVRQIVPGYNVWVVASCNGEIAWIKNVPTFVSIKNLDMDIDCGGNLAANPLPNTISFANRNDVLGCTFKPEDLNVGFGDGTDPVVQEQFEYTANTNVGIVNYDQRYTPFPGLNLGFGNLALGASAGAFYKPDCLWKYGGGDTAESRYECDYQGSMDTVDKATRSVLKGIPDELVEKAYRRFENRIAHQRELADVANPARTNHLLYGDCIGSVYKRYFQGADTDTYISCEEIRKCKTSVGNPFRNVQTTFSILARVASPISVWRMALAPERETTGTNGTVCLDKNGTEIAIADIQPCPVMLRQSSCVPGTAGCMYKLSCDYSLPQFFMMVGSGLKPNTYQTTGDAWGKSGMKIENPWKLGESEAEQAHWSGDKVIYNQGEKRKNNSVLTMARLVTNTLGNSNEVMGDVMKSPIDAKTPNFTPPTDYTIWDVGSDIESMCTLSAADLNIKNGVELVEETVDLAINNFFKGGHTQHSSHPGAGTSTYGTQIAIDRDRWLRESRIYSSDDTSGGLFANMFVRDLFDTAMTISEGGTVQDFSLLGSLPELATTLLTRANPANVYKSWAERTDDWNPDTPNEELTVTHCISGPVLEQTFPPFNGHYDWQAGDAGACYPWNDVPEGELCNVAPGPGNNPVGILRTCKVVKCQLWEKESKCVKRDEENKCIKWDVVESKENCMALSNASDLVTECLRSQLDTWNVEPDDPKNGEDESVLNCDLAAAGPMSIPSGLTRQQATEIKQEPLATPSDAFQANALGIVSTTDYFNLGLSSPVVPKVNSKAMAFQDVQTSNNMDTGGAESMVSQFSAGIPSDALGTGATTDIIKKISAPVGTYVKMDDYEPFVKTCNDTVCPIIQPPEPILIEDLPDGGVCKSKGFDNPNCPISVSENMDIVMGAAGANSGTPGSLILAAMWPEGAFGGSFPEPATFAAKWKWTNQDVVNWSEDWYDKMPYCNSSVWTAQGPFGLLTQWFLLAVAQGGFHEGRMSPNFPIPIVQKCNLIDAAYAASQMLSSYGPGSCSGWTLTQVEEALKVYRGGTDPTPTQMAIYNGCK